MNKIKIMLIYPIIAIFLLPLNGYSQAQNSEQPLSDLSIEDLMDIEITSVSRKKERISQTAASIYVISAEDIRRSGATTIPELLRNVPGLHVAKIDNARWAISARGENSLFANKLLVLIDGRSVYTPTFSGVYWDSLDTMLNDIERIEVIRGPGATVWGANAVNGVINIITKNANDTTDRILSGVFGNEEGTTLAARQGFSVSENVSGRVYGKGFTREHSAKLGGGKAHDAWEGVQSGARFDFNDGKNSGILQGDIYSGHSNINVLQPTAITPFVSDEMMNSTRSGGNILASYTNKSIDGTESTFKFYYDRVNRDELVYQSFDTIDLEAQQRKKLFNNHDFIYGLGCRYISDKIIPGDFVLFNEIRRKTDLISGFLQDTTPIFDDSLELTLGSKVEHNDYTGTEVQPRASLLWTYRDDLSFWGSVARAIKTPSRASDDVILETARFIDTNSGLPVLVTLEGDRSTESEQLIAYEIGARSKPYSNLSIDFSVYYNNYDDYTTIEPGLSEVIMQNGGPLIRSPLIINNLSSLYSYGLEGVITWKASERLLLQGWYTYNFQDVRYDSSSLDPLRSGEPTNPQNQVSFRSMYNLTENTEFDAKLRFVDSIESYGISAYTELDLRFAWRATKNLELSIAGFSLLHEDHREYEAEFVNVVPTAVERQFILGALYRF